jgi:hypothetical protein
MTNQELDETSDQKGVDRVDEKGVIVGGERIATRTVICSRTNSDFSCGRRNRFTPLELGRLRRELEKADSECRLRTIGSFFRAAGPAGSLLEARVNQGSGLPTVNLV